jgi:hypothetical protein
MISAEGGVQSLSFLAVRTIDRGAGADDTELSKYSTFKKYGLNIQAALPLASSSASVPSLLISSKSLSKYNTEGGSCDETRAGIHYNGNVHIEALAAVSPFRTQSTP